MAESDSGNSVRYNFAHLAIPVLALWNKKEFYGKAFSKAGKDYFQGIWDGLEQRMGVRESSEGLDSKVLSLKNGMELLMIQLPKPMEIPEAFFIGIAASVSKNFFVGKTVEEVRCFTLELGIDVETESPAFFVCEWKSPQPKPDRNTFGSLKSPDDGLFVQAIDYLVSDRMCRSLNGIGEVASTVTKDDDGRSTIATGPKSDLTAMLFSSAIVFSNSLAPDDKSLFSRWADLRREWTAQDREYFALAMLHHFHEAKTTGEFVPESIRSVVKLLPDNNLPGLSKRLTPEVKQLFNRMFGG